MYITSIEIKDKRFNLPDGVGSDATHTTPQYAYAVCCLRTDSPVTGIGLAFTLGAGTDLVCKAIDYISVALKGREIEELMADFGNEYRRIADSPSLRWLGPHKGVIHLALAAVVNACYDLWAKSRQVPLWQLLLDLTPAQLVNTLDLSYFEEVLTRDQAIALLENQLPARNERTGVLSTGYKGYDTSVGWFNYPDEKIVANTRKAMDNGFNAMKLKVGSDDPGRDIRRAALIRQTAGDTATIMVDANQKWNLPQALYVCEKLGDINPFWIEEPTHPDDVIGHQAIARAIAPFKVATGEHIPNKVIFKNFLQAKAMDFCQVDAVRVGGVSEFLTISLLARQMGVPVVPHVGDMGQIHQHLVLFNHIGMGHEHLFLEHIPHLRPYFVQPAEITGGYYQVPQVPGSSSDLKD
ncbi:L-fuconate dehydratase [Dyadobacter sp. BE34]|uniref:L-fuconate dehydratase n=1 Tax=Dyadobacter fermentans TaxID=94254 RepID=A0ABU1QVK3_9BACT|nr:MULTISPECIES: enolase C-terminal domain-like protein [Dyadobacter]MDR6805184.1 L-fuconate dehydratase [Dyadobacter fermentans]MDR7043057.1 L-fuconate dehydratase [Dyadobacter sp. BE242]MDR7197369.1 L-fuconate dehydratase [Dyadobacter sp. BE34]MDR7215198.1 L-fuconate dehydratase [Dyadobacter sp. BE31]MDR7262733.1 L-fuconate dehydratase [Dyadobacter sp. BE32]